MAVLSYHGSSESEDFMNRDELLRWSHRLAAEQAALQGLARAAAPLEEGEDLTSSYVDDADHWVGVYSELVEFKAELLREIDRQAMGLGQGAGSEVPRIRQALRLELERAWLHLEYWRRRRDELRAHKGDA